jgi:hypothetical protein
LPKAVAIVGCGGVGSWLAYFLALAGVPELWLYDHDTISASNLNRLPVPSTHLGRYKTEAMASVIRGMRPHCDVIAMKEWTPGTATAIKLAERIDWCAATTDTHANRLAVHKWSLSSKVHYIEASAEGEFGGATGAPAEWASDLEKDPGYASVPVHVGPCVVAATMACYHILHSIDATCYNYRMGWDGKAMVWQSRIDTPAVAVEVAAPKTGTGG